jgi:hypothetical protein
MDPLMHSMTQKIKRLPKAKAANFAVQDSIKSKLA